MLDDALGENFEHLIGRDDPTFADYTGSSMLLRIGVCSTQRLGGVQLIECNL